MLECLNYSKIRSELDGKNVAHLPIISYLAEHETERQRLIEMENKFEYEVDILKQAYEEKKSEIKKKLNALEEEAKTIEAEHKQRLEKITHDEKLKIRKIKEEVEVFEKQMLAELAERKVEAAKKLALANANDELQTAMIKLDTERRKENINFVDTIIRMKIAIKY